MGIFALLSFLPTEEQGRDGRLASGGLGRRLGARGRLWSEGKEREGGERIRSRLWLGPGWSEAARPRGWAAVSGGGRGGASADLGGGQGEGVK